MKAQPLGWFAPRFILQFPLSPSNSPRALTIHMATKRRLVQEWYAFLWRDVASRQVGSPCPHVSPRPSFWRQFDEVQRLLQGEGGFIV